MHAGKNLSAHKDCNVSLPHAWRLLIRAGICCACRKEFVSKSCLWIASLNHVAMHVGEDVSLHLCGSGVNSICTLAPNTQKYVLMSFGCK